MTDIDLNQLKLRRDDLDAEIEALNSQVAAKQAERDEIDAMLSKVVALLTDKSSGAGPETPKKRKRKKVTLDEKVLAVLKAARSKGLNTKSLKSAIDERYDTDVNISSLRTMLTTLKNDGKIHAHKRVWRIGRPPAP